MKHDKIEGQSCDTMCRGRHTSDAYRNLRWSLLYSLFGGPACEVMGLVHVVVLLARTQYILPFFDMRELHPAHQRGVFTIDARARNVRAKPIGVSHCDSKIVGAIGRSCSDA